MWNAGLHKTLQQCFLPTALFFLGVCLCVALFIAWVFVFASLFSLSVLGVCCFVHCMGVCFCVALFIDWAFVFVSFWSLLGCLPVFCFIDCLGVCSACLGWLSLIWWFTRGLIGTDDTTKSPSFPWGRCHNRLRRPNTSLPNHSRSCLAWLEEQTQHHTSFHFFFKYWGVPLIILMPWPLLTGLQQYMSQHVSRTHKSCHVVFQSMKWTSGGNHSSSLTQWCQCNYNDKKKKVKNPGQH